MKIEGFWKQLAALVAGIAVIVFAALRLASDAEMMATFLGAGGVLLAAGNPRKLIKAGATQLTWWQHIILLGIGAGCLVVAFKLRGTSMLARGPILATGAGCLAVGDPLHIWSELLGGSDDQAPPAPPAAGAGAA